MAHRVLPNRPVGNSREAKYQQALWDAVRSLFPITSAGTRTSHTTRGVIRQATGDGWTPPTPGISFRGEWSPLESYSEGDIVTRLEEGDVNDGYRAGTFLSIKSVGAGEGTPPAEYDASGNIAANTWWKRLARAAWKRLILRSDYTSGAETKQRLVDLSAAAVTGEDSTACPQIKLSDQGDTGTITIRLRQANGKEIKLREVAVCVDGEEMRMMVLASEPYAIT